MIDANAAITLLEKLKDLKKFSHLSSCLQLIATVGHLLLFSLVVMLNVSFYIAIMAYS